MLSRSASRVLCPAYQRWILLHFILKLKFLSSPTSVNYFTKTFNFENYIHLTEYLSDSSSFKAELNYHVLSKIKLTHGMSKLLQTR